MPLFDYTCTECGHLFESIQEINTMEIECENCQKTAKRNFPIPQKAKEGLSLADRRIRNKMKRKPKVPGAMFDNGKGKRW